MNEIVNKELCQFDRDLFAQKEILENQIQDKIKKKSIFDEKKKLQEEEFRKQEEQLKKESIVEDTSNPYLMIE